MSDLRWVIEDGRLWVERTGEGYRAWWDPATADEAATILQSVIERCARVADERAALKRQQYQNFASCCALTNCSAAILMADDIAADIRSLQIKGESGHE